MSSRFAHQERVLEQSKDLRAFALFWEMRCGKTRTTLETAAHLYSEGKIDAVLVLAPNGVHRVWTDDEAPLWLPGAQTFLWSSGSAATVWHKKLMNEALGASFPLVAMNYEAIMTTLGKSFAWKFLDRRRVFYVLDESTRVKTAGAKRTQRIVASGRHAAYRRVLTGTPITRSPFDIYKQLEFLDAEFWPRNGFSTYPEFRNFFAVYEKGTGTRKDGKKFEYEHVVAYRNLNKLQELVASISSRVLRSEVYDLPPKLYGKVYFEMSPKQRAVYEDLKKKFLTVFEDGELLTVKHKLTRLLRLAQVTSNHVVSDDGTERVVDPERNPRLNALLEFLDTLDTEQAIIWARFHRDIDHIMEALGTRAVRYDGLVSEDDRAYNKRQFKGGHAQFFVGNVSVGAFSHNLTEARHVVYYNNSFDLELRKHSEDRAEGPGQTRSVTVTDLVCPNSVDAHIVRNLRNKVDIASAVTGDAWKEWI